MHPAEGDGDGDDGGGSVALQGVVPADWRRRQLPSLLPQLVGLVEVLLPENLEAPVQESKSSSYYQSSSMMTE